MTAIYSRIAEGMINGCVHGRVDSLRGVKENPQLR
jgi:hypothetical protein